MTLGLRAASPRLRAALRNGRVEPERGVGFHAAHLARSSGVLRHRSLHDGDSRYALRLAVIGEFAAGDGGGGIGRVAGGGRGVTDGGGLLHSLHDGHGRDPLFGDEQLDGTDTRAAGHPGGPRGDDFWPSAHGQVGVGVTRGAVYSAVFWVARNLKQSALGRVLVAISEDEIFCQSLGKNVDLAKLQSLVLGAMLAAVPGALYAHYVSFIDPTSFTIHESIFILSIIIVGGMGNLWGSLAAAAFMMLVPEALRFVGLPGSIAANVRQIIYGAALVLVIWLQHSRSRMSSR